jgi:hypothetical protein
MVVPAEDRAAWVAALRRFATDAAARAAWAADPVEPRGAADMALQIERAYLDVLSAGARGGAEAESGAAGAAGG